MTTSTLSKQSQSLALHGGTPAISLPDPGVTRWGNEEREQLSAAVDQRSLFYWKGAQTNLLTERFRKHYPLEHVMACSSGTAAVHIAVAAAGIGPGDEVITSPITDMGTVIGVLYQQGVPVFADLEARTYNLDIESVKKCITPRTKAIIVVHLAGNPCDMKALKALADEHNLVLIEDCAQAWGALYQGAPVGTFGHIACFSFNDFKHIGCGDGGIVASNDARFGPLLQGFGDKAYDRKTGQRMPDVLAPNYRISELQSAFAAVQMLKMEDVTGKRARLGTVLTDKIAACPGIHVPQVREGDRCSFWFYLLRLNLEELKCTRAEFVEALEAEGVGCGAGYIKAPVYGYPVFQNHNFFAGHWPIREAGLTQMDYTKVHCPEAQAILEDCVMLQLHQGMDEEWMDGVAKGICKVAEAFQAGI